MRGNPDRGVRGRPLGYEHPRVIVKGDWLIAPSVYRTDSATREKFALPAKERSQANCALSVVSTAFHPTAVSTDIRCVTRDVKASPKRPVRSIGPDLPFLNPAAGSPYTRSAGWNSGQQLP